SLDNVQAGLNSGLRGAGKVLEAANGAALLVVLEVLAAGASSFAQPFSGVANKPRLAKPICRRKRRRFRKTDSGVASRSAIRQFGRIIILAMSLRCRKRMIIQQESSSNGYP